MNSYPILFEFDRKYPKKSPSQLFPGAPDDLLDLLYRMLDYNPNTRITAAQVFNYLLFFTVGFGTSIF